MTVLLLAPLILLLVGNTQAAVCTHAVDCGFPGITEQQCISNGCCWDNTHPNIWCSQPACTSRANCSWHGDCTSGVCHCDVGWTGPFCADTPITTVHVIQACHLDVGFADSAQGIINRYFTQHFPNITKIAQQLRDAGGNATLQFTAQSYVVSLYLNCPPNMGLACPDAAEVASFEAALKRGDITYHAFPFNAELEVLTPELVLAGLQVTHDIDKAYGFTPKITLSQRDVPGTTRASIPLLRQAGIQAISVGVNGASTPPAVPKIFKWVDPNSQQSIIAMWHPHGYGDFAVGSAVTVPGLSHAMVFDWNGDNAGPFDAATYQKHFKEIETEFPGAKVISSTFDTFVNLVLPFKDTLPEISKEIGDTWLYGCPSDPKKVAQLRALNRAWSKYIQAGGETSSVAYKNATRLVIKNGEHTWGRDVKSNLKDDTNWANNAFQAARANPAFKAQYDILEASWWEQRQWGIEIPVATLAAANHPLLPAVQAELAATEPQPYPNPANEGFVRVTNTSATYSAGRFTIGFDAGTGGVTTLVDSQTGTHWASSKHPLLTTDYRTYSQDDYKAFITDYIGPNPPDWAFRDFGKPNDTVSQHLKFTGGLSTLWAKEGAGAVEFLVQTTLGAQPHAEYGGPSDMWARIFIPTSGNTIAVNFTIYDKTPTRLPEAMFLTFNPLAQQGTWQMDKLGEWLEVNNVVGGGEPHHHGVLSGVRVKQPGNGGTLTIETLDAGVVCLGEPLGFPTPTAAGSVVNVTDAGVSSMLWNNLWGTNYVMWYPYRKNGTDASGEQNLLFRYLLKFQ
eukprot:TRINITY_DN40828_c0_g1_i1.p1 TRINITY_DN40828_c0_g1~~TRINITY_DN40828_c0_g1_i1.p1  ORF type:complete len:800 (-),score=122.49 TRINITY_DN40828_c0_g1_i1:16-2391(-)